MRHLTQKLWQNEFLKGGIAFTAASFIINILNYFFNSLVGKTLGPAGYGEVTALFSYVSIFSIPTLIISTIIIQKLGSTKENKIEYFQSIEHWFWRQIKTFWWLLIPLLILQPFLNSFTNLSYKTNLLVIPLILLTFISTFYTSCLQGLRMFVAFSLISVIVSIIKLAGPIFANRGIEGINSVLLFILLSSIFNLAGSLAVFRRKKSNQSDVEKQIQKNILHILKSRQFIITSLSIISITLFSNVDVVMAKKLLNAHDAGLYSSWSLFAKVILYAAGPIISVSFVFFSHLSTESDGKKTLLSSLLFISLLFISSFIFYKMCAPFLINMLFGKQFNPIIEYLTQASIFGSLYTTITFINNYFLAKKHSFSLILPLLLPIYILLLSQVHRTIFSIIQLNIIFGVCITVLYLIAYTSTFIYNETNGK